MSKKVRKHEGMSISAAKSQLRKLVENNIYYGVMMWGPAGLGKCLGRGTLVMKYDGSLVPVESVKVGDQLMGPDSLPRNVLEVSEGYGPLFEVSPIKGQPWVCNENHILTLMNTNNGSVEDISLLDWFNKGVTYRKDTKQFFPEQGIEFPPAKAPELDPYFLGVWLGDGTKTLNCVRITNPEPEIKVMLEEMAKEWGVSLGQYNGSSDCPTYRLTTGKDSGQPRIGRNPILNQLRKLMDDGLDIRVPKHYLTGSKETRRAVLAGLLDTDGYLIDKCFEIAQKNEQLASDIQFLARSLGIRAVCKDKVVNGQTYKRIFLSGDLAQLPLRVSRKIPGERKQVKQVNRTGIKVHPVGKGSFFGFTLDGDHRFLLGDFTVTHNSSITAQIARENKLELIDIRLGQLAPTDLRGLPMVDKEQKIAEWCAPEFLPRDPKSRGILFLDEINMAAPVVQGIAQQLVLDRAVGSYVLPPGWFVWAAGNRREDRAAVFEMPGPVQNRFLHLSVAPDHTAFHEYAIAKGLHEHLIAFLNYRPNLLHAQSDEVPSWPSPRTWEMASNLYASKIPLEMAIGDAAAAEFYAFLKVYNQIGYVDDIMAGRGNGKTFPDEPSTAYAIVTALGLRAKSVQQAQSSFEWINKQTKREWVQIFVSNLAGRWKAEKRFPDMAKLITVCKDLKGYMKSYKEFLEA